MIGQNTIFHWSNTMYTELLLVLYDVILYLTLYAVFFPSTPDVKLADFFSCWNLRGPTITTTVGRKFLRPLVKRILQESTTVPHHKITIDLQQIQVY